MAAKAGRTTATKRRESAQQDVAAFLAALDHPLKPEILVLRQIILDTDPSIAEGIKWNVPSFRTSEYFATMHLRATDSVQVILHLGAKVRERARAGMLIADPERLLEWLAPDRAAAKFRDLSDINARRAAFARERSRGCTCRFRAHRQPMHGEASQ